MRWYLLKTWVGREEELVKEIHRTVPPYMYQEAFVIYQERIWRRRQRSVVHVEPLLPGCVFITCKKTEPLFRRLELIPTMAKLMAHGDFSILPLTEKDTEFLTSISGEDHMVRLSYVLKNGEGNICRLAGPLKHCQEQVSRYQFKKRYALVCRNLWGEEKTLLFGILLKEDLRQKPLYEGQETSAELPLEAMG